MDTSESCRAISPQEMKVFLTALNEETKATLRSRLDWDRMVSEETYGANLGEDPEAAFLYAVQSLGELREFAKACVEHKCRALVVVG